MTTASEVKCPKCGEPAVQDGHTPSGTQRYKHVPCKWRGVNPATKQTYYPPKGGAVVDVVVERPRVSEEEMASRAIDITHGRHRRFVITGAQNATPVHEGFFESLLTYCEITGAELIVIPYRYKNPTSQWTEKNEEDDWWAPCVLPYLLDHRIKLGAHLEVLGDVRVQPTAKRPTSGFETMTGARSAIIAHPKLELVCIPTPQNRLPKIVTTTGVVTERNYVDARAGKQAEFHHTFGAAVVEVMESGGFHLRQINALDNGTFCDLNGWYAPKGEHSSDRAIKALILGDKHFPFDDKRADAAVFGNGGMLDTLRPEFLVWHDVHDGYSVNPHITSSLEKYVRATGGMADVEKDMNSTFAAIDARFRPGVTQVFPHSNHPGWLTKWAENFDHKSDFMNGYFWAKTRVRMEAGLKMGPGGPQIPDVFRLWAIERLGCYSSCKFLEPDEPFTLLNVELGMHGHLGPGGSRGSLSNLRKIGIKFVIGHVHGPGILDGGMAVGTLSVLDPTYASGPSNWLHTVCALYGNGKRSLINIIDGEWKL